jgi:photosystem II stability/assembly factor-like uncharacterized protein
MRTNLLRPVKLATILAVAIAMTIAGTPAHAGGAPATWHTEISGTTQPLYAIACITTARCTAVGAAGTILSTQNGGQTWTRQHSSLDGSTTVITRIACIAQRACYAIAPPSTILVTHNGGATWTSRTLPVSATAPIDATCVSANAYSIRGRVNLCRSGLTGVACTDAQTCYLTVAPAALFRTTDGGATWTPQIIPATVLCNGDCNAPGPYPLDWVSCPTAGACFAGGTQLVSSHQGFAAAILRMTAPGHAWVLVRGRSLGLSLDDAVCPRVAVCLGVFSTNPFGLDTSVYRTTDGGLTWTTHPAGSPRVRNAIACSGPNRCTTVGNQGTITQTTTGALFHKVHSPTSRNLYAVTCITAVTCYAVGNAGTILAR